jgi:phenylpyruvate tautomerase PptA (4-oxalocrotonate tautomerase family)
MPFINVKLIEGVFSPEQKETIAHALTDALVAVEGENMRSVTWCVIDRCEPVGAPSPTGSTLRLRSPLCGDRQQHR